MLEYWNNGMLGVQVRKDGILEYWNDGMKKGLDSGIADNE